MLFDQFRIIGEQESHGRNGKGELGYFFRGKGRTPRGGEGGKTFIGIQSCH